jgi:hypothetical protein
MMISLSDVLSSQHRQVFDLLDRAEVAPRPSVLETLANALVGHTLAEEQLVYPLPVPAPGSHVQALEEHALVRYALHRLLAAEPGKATFGARLRVLRELLVNHCEREERARLPAIEKKLGPPKSRKLARAVAERFEQLVARGHKSALRGSGNS